MSHRPTTCDPRRVALFLAQQLSDAEQAAFEAHLDHCGACRQALEEQTARKEVWAAARESLGAEPVWSEESFFGGLERGPLAADALLSEQEPPDRPELILRWLARSEDPRMLGRVENYEITGIVGWGGMGVVLKGLDPALNRYVAIKVLSPHLAASGSARRRFAREAQAVAAVVHENVLAIHRVAEWNGLPYLVMPYVRSESLQKRIDQRGPLEVKEILRIGRQVALGLAAAHAQGLVHRDIKPANILLEDGVERLKITDFGLARTVDDAAVTCSGVIAGTPQYMSPEQARGEGVDHRSDLFSLGSVLYAMCTGRPPFRAETSYGVLRRITDEEPRPIREVNPDIPEWLAATVVRLHAKDPADRYASAAEVAKRLEQCLAEMQQPSRLGSGVHNSIFAARPASRGKHVNRQKMNCERPTPLALRATIAALLLCLLFGGARAAWRFSFDGQKPADNDASSKASAVPAPAPASEAAHSGDVSRSQSSPSPDPAVEWNAAAQAIEELFHDGEEFRRRVEQVWDRPPAFRVDDSHGTPFSSQESSP